MIKQKNVKLAFIFAIVSVLATVGLVPYLLSIIPADTLAKNPMPFSQSVMGIIMGVQTGVMIFFLSWVGLILGKKVGLHTPIFRKWVYREGNEKISKKWILYGTLLALIGNILLLTIDRFVFLPYIPELKSVEANVSWWEGLLTMFYGGLVEEFIARLFVMTVIVWILSRLFSKGKTIHPVIYWIGIVAAGLIFGAMHLPTTAMALGGLTTIVIVRGLVLNLLLAAVFGYLYWKKGLEYAIIAHMLSDIILHAF